MTTLALSEEQVHEVVMALHDRRFETDRYLSGMVFHPCAPNCEHCAPKVEQAEKMKAGLQRRRDLVVDALTAFGDGPCLCGLRKGEHWKGDHK